VFTAGNEIFGEGKEEPCQMCLYPTPPLLAYLEQHSPQRSERSGSTHDSNSLELFAEQTIRL
jgi:hypothetical protein